eukprot:11186974-Lingulodinium_polyedra.AAC.1
MGHEWLWRALRSWGLPPWALEVADTLARGRTLQARVDGYEVVARGLLRSIGMGGPACTLLWNIGYDPVVGAVGGP